MQLSVLSLQVGSPPTVSSPGLHMPSVSPSQIVMANIASPELASRLKDIMPVGFSLPGGGMIDVAAKLKVRVKIKHYLCFSCSQ